MEEDELVGLSGESFVTIANDISCGDALAELGGLVVYGDLALLDQLVSLTSRHAKRQRHEFVEALSGFMSRCGIVWHLCLWLCWWRSLRRLWRLRRKRMQDWSWWHMNWRSVCWRLRSWTDYRCCWNGWSWLLWSGDAL